MKIAILGSKDPGKKNSVMVLAEKFKKLLDTAIAVTNIKFEDLIFNISNDQQSIKDYSSGQDLADFDMVIALNWYRDNKDGISYRDMAYATALYLQKNGVNFWNYEMIMQRSSTKLSAMMQLAINNFSIPTTVYSPNVQAMTDNLGGLYPLILKAMSASRGKDNYLIKNDVQANEIILANEFNKFLLQANISNTGDYRILCANGKPVYVVRRQRMNESTHLNNLSQGAVAEVVDLSSMDPSILWQCQEISLLMGRELAGIDLIIDSKTGKHYYLEVNAIPQITSGSNVDIKITAIANAINELSKENIK